MAFNKSKVMDAARRAVEKGQLDKAVKEYLKVVREDPKDVRVWLKVGDLYAKKGAKQDATDTYLKVAKFYGEQGFNRKAVAVYKQILKIDPRLVEVNLKLAELYRQLGLLSEAMQHFERVAAFFHREGKTREALATIRQLVELDPDNVATRIKLAELYSAENLVEDAVTEFELACDYLRRKDREDDFLKVAERLLWHQPENVELNRELAASYLRRGDPRRALQKLQVCFKADSGDVETLALLAQSFQQLDQRGKTVSVLKEMARVLSEGGQEARAAEVHEKILQYVPGDPDSLAFLSRSRSRAEAAPVEPEPEPQRLSADDLHVTHQGRMTGAFPLVGDQDQPDAAIGHADPQQEPLDLSIDEDAAFDDVGSLSGEVHADEIIKILTETDVYVKYGLHEKAIEHLRRVFDLDPENIEAREQLKDILLSQGREGEAIGELMHLAGQTAMSDPDAAGAYLREVLSIDAGYRDAHELAARYQIQIASDVEVVTEESGAAEVPDEGGAVAPVEDDDFGFGFADDLALGSPAPGPNPNAPEVLDEGELLLDIESEPAPAAAPTAGTGTQEVDLDQVDEASPLEAGNLAADPLADPADLGAEPMFSIEDVEVRDDTGQTAREPARMESTDEVEELRDDDVEMIEVGDEEVYEVAEAELEEPDVVDRSSGTSLEDDLDEADFFLAQGLLDEARDILDGLLQRYPDHPLVVSKLDEIAALEQDDTGATLDVPASQFEEPAPERAEPVPPMGDTPQPQVMLEKPVDDEDADTHYDLGLAYKEMGLYDEAIKSFEKVVHVRGVQCHLMIGLCHREQGQLSEAISQFKAGLYVDGISEREKYSLYYEIGTSYEALGDAREALYYHEIVLRKDPAYRDVRDRSTALRRQLGDDGTERARQSTLDDDTDAALDLLPGSRR